MRVRCEGGTITVWRGAAEGSGMTQVLHTTAAPVTTTQRIEFTCDSYADFSIDDIRALAGNGLTTTYTHTHNMANELTSVTANGGNTNFSYDYWGRMLSKSLGSYTTGYAWHYGGKLTRVASTFPGEGTVTYGYGGDQERRERNHGTITKYNWDRGWNMINEENSAGVLVMTYLGRSADFASSNPSSGPVRYYGLDHLGSTRSLWNTAKDKLGSYEYTPYGEAYSASDVKPLFGFTGHQWDAINGLNYAPYRYYSPSIAKWLSRDPWNMADGPNAHAYVRGNPVLYIDQTGQITIGSIFLGMGIGGIAGCVLSMVQTSISAPEGDPPSGSELARRCACGALGGAISGAAIGSLTGAVMGGAGGFAQCMCEAGWDSSKTDCCARSAAAGALGGLLGGLLGEQFFPDDEAASTAAGIFSGILGPALTETKEFCEPCDK